MFGSLNDAFNSLDGMSDKEAVTNEQYKEILVLAGMLKSENIPFEIKKIFGGYHIMFPSRANIKCSVVEHNGSYGRNVDKLEIMGLLTEDEQEVDSVAGYLTAEDVFERIKKDYEKVRTNKMIKSDMGTVEIRGSRDIVEAEFITEIMGLKKANFSKEKILEMVDTAFKKKEEESPDIFNEKLEDFLKKLDEFFEKEFGEGN